MSKEKQIEEISKILTEAAHKACEDIPFAPPSPDDRCIRPTMECHRCKEARALIDAGYRKQSENVIELPCRVGDTMYVKYKGIAYPVKVNAIRIDTKKNNHRICVSGTFHLYEYYDHNYKATFPFDSIGKSLFYTEAEAKMKGGAE